MTNNIGSNVVIFPVKLGAGTFASELKEIHQSIRELSYRKKQIEDMIYKEINDSLPNRGTYRHEGVTIKVSERHKVDTHLARRLMDEVDLPVDLFRVKYEVNQKALDDLREYYDSYLDLISPVITTDVCTYMTVK